MATFMNQETAVCPPCHFNAHPSIFCLYLSLLLSWDFTLANFVMYYLHLYIFISLGVLACVRVHVCVWLCVRLCVCACGVCACVRSFTHRCENTHKCIQTWHLSYINRVIKSQTILCELYKGLVKKLVKLWLLTNESSVCCRVMCLAHMPRSSRLTLAW